LDHSHQFIVSEHTSWATLEKVLAASAVALFSEAVMATFGLEIAAWYQQERRLAYVIAALPTRYVIPTLICPNEINSQTLVTQLWP
ncbi:MAG: hypothetical protein ACRC1D_04020, partial [Culicoidibacterales bacterium]